MLSRSYQAALEAGGHHVIACVGAQDAIAEADQQTPDVVVMELQLVAHNGLEFLYEFRSYVDWQTTPVVVQSYVPSHHLAANWSVMSQRLGVTDYLYKPQASLRQLIAAVDDAAAAPVSL